MAAKTALRQQVYEQIKHDIVTCRLAPGEPLSETQFLSHFQVSKTPIREALTSLVQDGLVEYTPNRGFMVTPVSLVDIREIFEVRIFFETEIFRLAARNISQSEIDHLDSLSHRVVDANAPEYAELFLEANLRFHLAVAAAAHNSRLLWYYEKLMNEAQRLFFMDVTLHRKDFPWAHGHEEIMGALRKRDEDAGIAAIRSTLEDAHRRILGA